MATWNGIMRIAELVHRDCSGAVVRRETNIFNRIHLLGEEFVLRSLFAGGEIPVNYYIGLDSRASISQSDLISDISGVEPTAFGYERQAVRSDNFAIVAASPTACQADSPTVLFTASGGSWGPVKNVFLCAGLGYGSNATLISSASIGQDLVVSSGETVSMRMAMSLSAC